MNQQINKPIVTLVDQAKFKNTRCSGCKALIARNVLRMGIVNSKLEFIDRWYHVGCMGLMPQETILNLELSQIQGLDELSKQLIEVFMKTFNEVKSLPKRDKSIKKEKSKESKMLKLQSESEQKSLVVDVEDNDEQFRPSKKTQIQENIKNDQSSDNEIVENEDERNAEKIRSIESCLRNFIQELNKPKQ